MIVDFLLSLIQLNANGRSGWGDMLERRSGGEVEGLLELPDEGVSIQGIEKVDVSRRAAES